MATSYWTKDGQLAFVYCPSTGGEKYYTVLMPNREKGVRRLRRRLLPVRFTEGEAQSDLDYYAKLHGWKPAYGHKK